MATGFYNNAGTDIGDFFEGGTGNQTFGYKVSDGSDIGSLYLNKSEGTAGDSVGFKNSSGTDIGTLLCKKGTNGIKYGPFTIPSNSVKAPTGRYYYRHSSGMGSVMCWCDRGTYRRTLVLDKQYCSNRSWASVYGSNTDISGIANYTSGVGLLLESASNSPSAYDGMTDSVLDSKSFPKDSGTSTSNTDAMMKYSECSGTDYAAGYCRSIKVNGQGCSLPNVQTLVRMLCDRATIDSLDSSTKSNFSWSNWSFEYSDIAWSSSEYSSNQALGVSYSDVTWLGGGYDSSVYNYYKHYDYYEACPVLEL